VPDGLAEVRWRGEGGDEGIVGIFLLLTIPLSLAVPSFLKRDGGGAWGLGGGGVNMPYKKDGGRGLLWKDGLTRRIT
jgi:hypothetical protein